MISHRELSLSDILHLTEIPTALGLPELRSKIGGLALHLGQLHRLGIPIVDGLVLAPDWFGRCCQQVAIPAQMEPTSSRQVFAQQCQAATQAGMSPEWEWQWQQAWTAAGFDASLIIVRPSLGGDFPFAVQELLTPQIGTIDELATMVTALWAEVFCGPNLCFWQNQGVPLDTIPLATLMQPLPIVEQSGRFWVSQEQIVVERFWGIQWLGHPQEVEVHLTVLDRATGTTKFSRHHPQQLIHTILGHWPQSLPKLEPLLVPGNQWLIPHALPERDETLWESPPSPVQDNAILTLCQTLSEQFHQPLRVDWQYSDAHLTVQAVYPGERSPFSQSVTQLLSSPPAAEESSSPPAAEELSPHLGLESVVDEQPDGQLIATGVVAGHPKVSMGRAVVIHDHQVLMREMAPQSILVTSHLTPEWLPLLRQAEGLITEQGGITSHAAVIARSLGIPAIIGVPGITEKVVSGSWLQIDAANIYQLDARDVLQLLEAVPSAAPIASPGPLPDDQGSHRVILLSTVSDVSQLSQLPSHQGIGLLRGEHLLAPYLAPLQPWQTLSETDRARLTQQLVNQLKPIVQPGLPVWYRLSDWRSHEVQPRTGIPQESNPALGQHGMWRYQQQPEWLALELQALRQLTEPRSALHLILPFVRTVEEVRFCQEQLSQIGLANMSLWVMVEVPSMQYVLPELSELGVDGIVLGLNDLVQLLFGVDRDQAVMQDFFNPSYGPVKSILHSALQRLIDAARAVGLVCHVCSVPSDAEFIQFLVDAGVTGLVIEPADWRFVQTTIATMSH